MDVHLAPLEPGVFNEAKSSIKWSEAALVETPTLAMATEPFRLSVEHGRTGLLADSADDWESLLEEAYEDRERLRRIGVAAREAAATSLSPWILGRRLVDTLSELSKNRPPCGRSDPPTGWPDECLLTAMEPPGLYPGWQSGPQKGGRDASTHATHAKDSDLAVLHDPPNPTGDVRRRSLDTAPTTGTIDDRAVQRARCS